MGADTPSFMNPVELSEKLLGDAGGWREIKEARALHREGKVSDAKYENGMLEASVRRGGKDLRVRIEIRSATDMENFCPCFPARRDGIICCHALAAGLEFLKPQSSEEEENSKGNDSNSRSQGPSAENGPAQPISPDWPRLVESGDEEALPVELCVIFPPRFQIAWEQGSLTIGIEAITGENRRLLPGLQGETIFLDSADSALFRCLQAFSPGKVPASLTLPRNDFLTLLENLSVHPRLTFGKKDMAAVNPIPRRPILQFCGKNWKIAMEDDAFSMIGNSRFWVLQNHCFSPVAPGLPESWFEALSSNAPLDPALVVRDRDRFSDWFEVDPNSLAQLPVTVNPKILLNLEGSVNHQEANLFFQYGERSEPARVGKPREVEGGISNPDAEEAAVAELESFGFQLKREGIWQLKNREEILLFLADRFSTLNPNWIVTTGERFEHALSQVEPIALTFRVQQSGEDWFELNLDFAAPSGSQFADSEIRRLLESGRSSLKTDGKTAVINPDLVRQAEEMLIDTDPRQSSPGTYCIDADQAGYVAATARDSGIKLAGDPLGQGARELPEVAAPLADILRPYQREGVHWMLQLAVREMGGILADDMGLGKTLQTLAMLDTAGGAALVICPSSLVSNWIDEAEKFTPDLKAVAVTGESRKKVYRENTDARIFVTSYALLRRDIKEWVKRGEFDFVILDEAQQIKNPDAKVTKAALQLQARCRFALTGTPLENSVRDLWPICQFVNRGYLGGRAWFDERFVKPCEKDDSAARVRLQRRLSPILLRRRKSEVATDLPEKIEQVIYCDLTQKQREIYDQFLREIRGSIAHSESRSHKRMTALTGLLRLRQICCDLRLLKLSDSFSEAEASVKLGALRELVTQSISGNHRVLVFSQFVELLQVLVPLLGEMQIPFCYLDGATRKRAEVINKFQVDETIPVFLISLKAGGVGLNLTGADTVIHLDPWWNPAVEDQATDRAHRIGQTRVVTSYKLITRSTVEEKILRLQDKKREAIQAVVEGSPAAFPVTGESGLSETELMELIEE